MLAGYFIYVYYCFIFIIFYCFLGNYLGILCAFSMQRVTYNCNIDVLVWREQLIVSYIFKVHNCFLYFLSYNYSTVSEI